MCFKKPDGSKQRFYKLVLKYHVIFLKCHSCSISLLFWQRIWLGMKLDWQVLSWLIMWALIQWTEINNTIVKKDKLRKCLGRAHLCTLSSYLSLPFAILAFRWMDRPRLMLKCTVRSTLCFFLYSERLYCSSYVGKDIFFFVGRGEKRGNAS